MLKLGHFYFARIGHYHFAVTVKKLKKVVFLRPILYIVDYGLIYTIYRVVKN